MNARDLLAQVRSLDFEIHAKVKQAEKMEAALDRACSLNGYEEAAPAFEFAGMALYIRHGVDRLNALANEATARVEALKTPKHRQVLLLRYFLCYPWDEIARKMKYSRRQTHRIHNAALAELDEVLKSTGQGADIP